MQKNGKYKKRKKKTKTYDKHILGLIKNNNTVRKFESPKLSTRNKYETRTALNLSLSSPVLTDKSLHLEIKSQTKCRSCL